jgi:hypothetical protein
MDACRLRAPACSSGGFAAAIRFWGAEIEERHGFPEALRTLAGESEGA